MTMYERVLELCKKENIPVTRLEKELNFSKGSISKMKKSVPLHGRVQKIADYFGVTLDYLMNGDEAKEKYYLDDETREVAQELLEHPELKMLFSASRNVSTEDLKLLHEMALRMKKKEIGGNDEEYGQDVVYED